MKILVISHMYPTPYNETHGIFIHQQITELIKQGCDVRVVSPVPWAPFPIYLFKKKWRKYAINKHKAVKNGVEIFYPRYIAIPRGVLFEYAGLFMYWGIKKLVQDIYCNFKFDIIHSHVALPDGFAGMKLRKNNYKKPLVVTIHGQDLQHTIYKNNRCLDAIKKVIKNANKVITVSSKLRKLVYNNFGYSDNIKVINNGINHREVTFFQRNDHQPINGRDSKDILILSVSNLIKSKGIDLNIKAVGKIIDKYPYIKYLIVGDGPEIKRLKELTSGLGLGDNVFFLGRLPNSDVIRYMAQADIFSMPSWNEGFGVVYLEAMACGKPVIACLGEGIEDVIQNGKTGILVKPKDVNDLMKNLEYLIKYPEKAKSIGERAKELVLNKYTWEQNAKQTIQVYEEVLRNAKS